MQIEPLVTIGVLFYNAENRVINTLNSILSQTYSKIQLIIVDDFSTDRTASLIETWIKEKNLACQFIHHFQNKGICASLNEILTFAEGKYFAIIGDDEMCPEKIKGDVEFMENNSELGFCHSNILSVNETTRKESLLKSRDSKNFFHEFFSWNIVVYTPSLFYRKEVFDKVGTYDEKLIFEDYDMILRISYEFPVGYRDEVTIRYIRINSKGNRKRGKILVIQLLEVTKKWDFLKNYKYYLARRHLSLFYYLSIENKLMSVKYSIKSLRFISDKRLYSAIFRFFFKW